MVLVRGHGRGRLRLSLVLATASAALLIGAPAAHATRIFSVSSVGSVDPMTVGETGTRDLKLTNVSDAGETVSPNQLWLTASCGTNTSPCDTPDLGVFSLASVTGTDGVCAGDSFNITADETFDTGGFKITPVTPRTLNVNDFCTYHFVYNVLRVPTNDSDLVTTGVQTRQRLYEKVDEHLSGTSSSALGDVTVNPCSAHCPVVTPPPTTTTPTPPGPPATKKKCKKKHRRAAAAKKCRKKK